MSESDISKAVTALQSGGVIAYPTEAVFGLGCDPQREDSLARIIEIKSREAHKGFIIIASSLVQLRPYLAPIQAEWQAQFDAAWPGPVTFVVPASQACSDYLTGGRETVAVRVSQHSVVKQLCDAFGGAMVSTSANRSGEPPVRNAESATALFGDEVDVIVRADVGTLESPTQIVDVCSGQRLR